MQASTSKQTAPLHSAQKEEVQKVVEAPHAAASFLACQVGVFPVLVAAFPVAASPVAAFLAGHPYQAAALKHPTAAQHTKRNHLLFMDACDTRWSHNMHISSAHAKGLEQSTLLRLAHRVCYAPPFGLDVHADPHCTGGIVPSTGGP